MARSRKAERNVKRTAKREQRARERERERKADRHKQLSKREVPHHWKRGGETNAGYGRKALAKVARGKGKKR